MARECPATSPPSAAASARCLRAGAAATAVRSMAASALAAGAMVAACTTAPVAPARDLSDGSAAQAVGAAEQLLVVRAASWDATGAELRRYQRPAPCARWARPCR
jgi:hypothetical protein